MTIPQLQAIDLLALGPLLVLLFGALLMLFIESFFEKFAQKYSWVLTLAILGLGLLSAATAPASENALLTPWLRFDDAARFFTILFLAIGFGCTLLASSFFRVFQASQGEYYFLLLSAIFGLILIGGSADYLTLFLGIETLSLSLYILTGFMKRWKLSHEAALKFFLMGALATAFLVYGIAMMYGGAGTTRLDLLFSAYKKITDSSERTLFLAGAAFITAGLAFKAAVVPFHIWAPDVYEGAPTPVTAFLAVGSKLGAFAALYRVFLEELPNFDAMWNQGISVLAYLSIIYANLLALRQTHLKRFFAYSGISHAGFMLIPIAAETPASAHALLFYFVVYAAATLCAFAVISLLEKKPEGVTMHDLKGLYKRAPFAAGLLTLALLTLAGVPPTAGFFAKFYLFKAAFQAGYIGLVIVGLLATVVAIYYYLRMVAMMFAVQEEKEAVVGVQWSAVVLGSVVALFIAYLSVHPAPLLEVLSWAVK